MKKILFYILAFLIPILFIVIVEYSMRASDYGADYQVFIEDEDKDYLLLNPDLGRKYFLNDDDFTRGQYDVFKKEKGENEFRIFTLGASTVAGFPYQHGASFPRMLEHRLQSSYEGFNFEVINVSLAATNSYFIADVIEDVLDQEPDAIVIYSGHNEFYGSFGVGSTHKISARWFIPYYLKLLRNNRITQFIRNLTKSESSEQEFDGTLMAKMVGDKSIELDSKSYKRGVKQYSNNMSSVLNEARKKGVPVFLGTLFSNIKDQKPFIHTVDSDSETKNDALVLYEKGRYFLENGITDSAAFYLKKAKDNDLLRFRAPEELNEQIRSLADAETIVVDLERIFAENSEGGLTGNELISEHLHPNIAGNELMAGSFEQSISDFFDFTRKETDIQPFEKTYSPLDSLYGEFLVERLTSAWPFTDNFEVKANPRAKFDSYAEELAYKRSLEQLTWVAAQNMLFNYYYSQGDFRNAIRCAIALSQEYPHIVEPKMMTASCYYQLGLMEKEISTLKNAFEVKKDPRILQNLAIRQFVWGSEEEAFLILAENLEVAKSGGLINLYNDLAETVNLKKAIESEDDKVTAQNNLLEIYLRNRCFEKAEGLINDLKKSEGNSEMVLSFENRLLALKNDRRYAEPN